MDVDIDIEEHNVLDDPKIKTIFPDLTIIKTEVPDIVKNEVPDLEVDESAEYDDYQNEMEWNGIFDNLDTIQDQNQLSSEMTSSENEYPWCSKIILGNKPNPSLNSHEESENPSFSKNSHQDCFQTSVVLENWGPNLEKSEYFCKDCLILFPTLNALDSHKMSAHSFLIPQEVDRNKAIKSTAKNRPSEHKCKICEKVFLTNLTLKKHYREEHLLNSKAVDAFKICNHCNNCFADENALFKHLYELLPSTETPVFECEECCVKFESKMALDSHDCVSKKCLKVFKCDICSCNFHQFSYFQSHMVNNHKTTRPNATVEPFDPQCRFCTTSLVYDYYNYHIRMTHWIIFTKKQSNKKKIVQSPYKKIDKTRVTLNTKRFKCVLCHVVCHDRKACDYHRRTAHKDVQKRVHIFRCTKILKQKVAVKKVMDEKISALFKCKYCALHFLSCISAEQHVRQCSANNNPDKVIKQAFKCKICHKLLKIGDVTAHERDHSLISKFKVYVTQEGIYKRILCKCPKCHLYFTENTYAEHEKVRNCKSIRKFTHCDICDLDIYNSNKYIHRRHHKVEKFTREDFIKVDKVDSKQLQAIDEPKLASLNPKVKQIKHRLIYCETCDSYFGVNRYIQCHKDAKCRDIMVQKVICATCGLKFFEKSMLTHLCLHRLGVKFENLIFLNLHNLLPIRPVVPSYPTCEKCGVSIINSTLKHSCSNKSIACDICKKKYGKSDFDLHQAFHEYGKSKSKAYTATVDAKAIKNESTMNEILKKYNKLNVLLSCPICNCVADTYRTMESHIERHKRSVRNIMGKCKICNLRFESTSWKRHKKLHLSSKNICKSYFKIINFQGKQGRNTLTKKTGSTMKVNKQKINLYKCTECNCIFPHVAHAKKHVCNKNPTKTCVKCKLCIPINHLKNHLLLHKKTPNFMRHLSLIEYKPARKEVAKPQQSINKTDVELYTCPCGLSCPSLPNILKHYNTCVAAKKLPNILTELKSIQNGLDVEATKPSQKSPRLQKIPFESNGMVQKEPHAVLEPTPSITLYKCSLCKTLFVIESMAVKHVDKCKGKNRGCKCEVCGLVFHSLSIQMHRLKKNCQELSQQYQVTEITKESVDKLKTLYKCRTCKIHFMSFADLKKHYSDDHRSGNSARCRLCKFTFINPLPHIELHHNRLKYERHNFSIKRPDLSAFDPAKKNDVTMEIPNTISNNNAKKSTSQKTVATMVINKVTNSSPSEVKTVENDSPSESRKLQSSPSSQITVPENVPSEIRTLFKCEKCSLHFLQWAELFEHVLSVVHNPNGETEKTYYECSHCKLAFCDDTLPKHIVKHHQTYNVLTADFIIDTDVSAARIIEYTSKITMQKDVGKSSPVSNVINNITSKIKTEIDENDRKNEFESPDQTATSRQHVACEINGTDAFIKCSFCPNRYESQKLKEFHESLIHLDCLKNCNNCGQTLKGDVYLNNSSEQYCVCRGDNSE